MGMGDSCVLAVDKEIDPRARQIHISGLIMKIVNIEILDFNPGNSSRNKKEKSSKSGEGVLALTFQIFNETNANCQIRDLQQTQFRLLDKSGRVIPFLSRTEKNAESGKLAEGEFYQLILYFQKPEISRQNYQLEVKTSGFYNLPEVLTLEVPSRTIVVIADMNRKRIPESTDMQIIFPLEGQEVEKGEELAVEVKMSDMVEKPNRFYVLLPKFTFEDNFTNLKYKIRIPSEVPVGPYSIVFMAVWDKTPDFHAISHSVKLQIVESKNQPQSR